MIVIEGIIGAGKSTFMENIKKNFPDKKIKLYPEPVENNPYLEDFYKDPKTYAEPLQKWMYRKRYEIHYEAILDELLGVCDLAILDRSIYGDKCFCDILYDEGYISNEWYKDYIRLYKLAMMLPRPQLIIFLDVDTEVSYNRIMNRGRLEEKNIKKSYLSNLYKQYEILVEELRLYMGSQLQILDWNEFQDLKDSRILEVIKNATTYNFT